MTEQRRSWPVTDDGPGSFWSHLNHILTTDNPSEEGFTKQMYRSIEVAAAADAEALLQESTPSPDDLRSFRLRR